MVDGVNKTSPTPGRATPEPTGPTGTDVPPGSEQPSKVSPPAVIGHDGRSEFVRGAATNASGGYAELNLEHAGTRIRAARRLQHGLGFPDPLPLSGPALADAARLQRVTEEENRATVAWAAYEAFAREKGLEIRGKAGDGSTRGGNELETQPSDDPATAKLRQQAEIMRANALSASAWATAKRERLGAIRGLAQGVIDAAPQRLVIEAGNEIPAESLAAPAFSSHPLGGLLPNAPRSKFYLLERQQIADLPVGTRLWHLDSGEEHIVGVDTLPRFSIVKLGFRPEQVAQSSVQVREFGPPRAPDEYLPKSGETWDLTSTINTLKHPQEIETFLTRWYESCPQWDAEKAPKEARASALENMSILASGYREEVRPGADVHFRKTVEALRERHAKETADA